MPLPARYSGPTNSLLKIGEFNGYIVEYNPHPNLEDEVTKSLKENIGYISRELDDDGIYIQIDDLEKDDIPASIRREYDSYPILAVFDEHPARCAHAESLSDSERSDDINNLNEQGDIDCLVFELGDLTHSTEVTDLLKLLAVHVQQEHFMKELSWEKRKMLLQNKINTGLDIGGLGISIISLMI